MFKKVERFTTISKGKHIIVELKVEYWSVFTNHCKVTLTDVVTDKQMEITVWDSYPNIIKKILTLAHKEQNSKSYNDDFDQRIAMVEKRLKNHK